ncbi:P2Y purinoceptor 14-like [Sebastes umbrosus]|uniref:P2Y purinoceptor 14-like n=1 Tax=Sebastes umbrosus TaxID=72105 RepID=UPI0018A06885|nr:P2Y purinoceptor 14-like [Sebastes umbrosus]
MLICNFGPPLLDQPEKMSDQSGEVTTSLNQSSVTNQTELDGSSNCDQPDSLAHPYLMVAYGLVFLVGLLLNGFVMKFYFCRAQQKASSSIMIYLKNLAAADFLLCLSLPIRIAHYSSSSITIRILNCNFGAVVLYLNMYSSIMFMGYIAANRYLMIVQPSGTHILQTVRAAHIISTVTWVLLLSVTSVFVIMSFHKQEPSTSVPVSCESLQSGQVTLLQKIINTCSTATFLFFLVFLVFFYYSTSRRVSLAQQRQPASSSSTKLAKSRRNMLVLVSVFCFCFVPYHLIRLPRAFLSSYCSWSNFLYYVKEVSILMSVLNVCLDPLIYFILSKSFRTQFRLGVMSGN